MIRAMLPLDEGRLTVETMSEPRLERVLGGYWTTSRVPASWADVRRPFEVAAHPAATPPLPLDGPKARAALGAWLDRHKRSWCDEQIPCSAGLEAADPTRRESLERLLATTGGSERQRRRWRRNNHTAGSAARGLLGLES